MAQETVSISIPVYRVPVSGEHTCGVDFGKRATCPFIGSARLGLAPVCNLTGDYLESFDGGLDGYLEPTESCLIRKAISEP